MPIVSFPSSDREKWLEMRKQDVTASVAGALLGQSPYTTAYGLWAEKTGRLSDDTSENAAMRRGRLLEDDAVQILAEERPDWTIKYPIDLYFRDTDARLGATPDAYAERPDFAGFGIVQIKTASDHAFRNTWRDKDTGDVEVPLWIAVQAIVEADLTGASWACVVVMVVGHGLDIHVIDVPLHAGVKRKVREAVAEFWAMVESGAEPPINWKQDGRTVLDVYRESDAGFADLSDNNELNVLVADYVAARDAASVAEKTKEFLRPQIIHALGNFEAGETAGFEIKAKTQHRAAYSVKESQSRVLRIKAKGTRP